MLNQVVQIPRWRALILCLAGAVGMTKPLTGGLSMYRAAVEPSADVRHPTYGLVCEAGPYTPDERSHGEARLRETCFPQTSFTEGEVEEAAGEVRAAAWPEVRQARAARDEQARRAWADRMVGAVTMVVGGGGIAFYVWLGWVMLHEGRAFEAALNKPKVPRAGWFGRRRKHGRITFGVETPH